MKFNFNTHYSGHNYAEVRSNLGIPEINYEEECH